MTKTYEVVQTVHCQPSRLIIKISATGHTSMQAPTWQNDKPVGQKISITHNLSNGSHSASNYWGDRDCQLSSGYIFYLQKWSWQIYKHRYKICIFKVLFKNCWCRWFSHKNKIFANKQVILENIAFPRFFEQFTFLEINLAWLFWVELVEAKLVGAVFLEHSLLEICLFELHFWSRAFGYLTDPV